MTSSFAVCVKIMKVQCSVISSLLMLAAGKIPRKEMKKECNACRERKDRKELGNRRTRVAGFEKHIGRNALFCGATLESRWRSSVGSWLSLLPSQKAKSWSTFKKKPNMRRRTAAERRSSFLLDFL